MEESLLDITANSVDSDREIVNFCITENGANI